MSMIKAENLSFTYPGSYDPVFEDVSFQLDTNWKLGLVGRNGRGKTTLLRLLAGELAPDGGSVLSCPVPTQLFPFPPGDTSRTALEVAREAVARTGQALLEVSYTDTIPDRFLCLLEEAAPRRRMLVDRYL